MKKSILADLPARGVDRSAWEREARGNWTDAVVVVLFTALILMHGVFK